MSGTAAEADRRRRVLHVFGVMDRGGAEMRTVELMRATRDECAHEFATLGPGTGALNGEIESLGGLVHPCVLGPSFPARFVALCRRRRIDVVHSHVYLTSGGLLALAAAAGVRNRIAHFRTTSDGREDRVRRLIYRGLMRAFVDRFATSILGVSRAALDFGWKPDWQQDPRCLVVPNGVDPIRFDGELDRLAVRRALGLPGDVPLAVHVGRFAWVKNQPRAVDVFAASARSHPGHLAFVGRTGAAGAQVNARIEHHLLGDRVHCLDERGDVPQILRAADVLLLTSRHEGMPGAVLEALAAGLPVISDDLPGVREIAEQLPGVTIIPRDAGEAVWASAITEHLASIPDENARAAARATFAASRFSIGYAAREMRRIWLR